LSNINLTDIFIFYYFIMKLLSSWRRGEVYITEMNWKKIAIKKAKDNTKKWAIKREITILLYLKWKVDFVPQILDYGDDWFSYEFIEGVTLDKIKDVSKDIYLKLVEYAYILDQLNVEHGELSRPTKNIIVNNSYVFIIDFERWNLMNKSFKNLKAISQFFLNRWILSIEDLKFDNPERFKEFLTKKIELLKSR